MPKNMNVIERLRELEKAGNPNHMEQVPVRFPYSVAIKLYRECLLREMPPGVRLREIVVDHYQLATEGAHVAFDSETRQNLDKVARIYNLERETVVKICVQRSLTAMLEEAQSERKRQMDAAKKLDNQKP